MRPENVTRFRVPEGLFYHQGHGWLRPEPGAVGVVGIDDFARKLIGKVDSVELPAVGSQLAHGDRGWSIVADSVPVPMLSTVDGEVIDLVPALIKLLEEAPKGARLSSLSRQVARCRAMPVGPLRSSP